MLIKTKQLVYKGKKLRAFKVVSEEFLRKLEKATDTKKGHYVLIYNDKVTYLFDDFFVWKKTNEYVYLYKDSLIKTRFFVGDGLKEKDLLKWKNKIFGEKNNGRKQACTLQGSKKNVVNNKSKTKNKGGKNTKSCKPVKKAKKVQRKS